jgi:HCOMODA/2-hydroxy-3-carboxy-muconic semialdehyde decarboxylase
MSRSRFTAARVAPLALLLLCAAAVAGGTLVAAQRDDRPAPASAGPADPQRVADLVAANHIVHTLGLLDGYGHVSVRHDKDPNRFLMGRSMGPAAVTAADIMEFDLESAPVDQRGRQMHGERFIHGQIYKARPDVMAVVHSHAPPLVPFGVIDEPLRPVFHMSAFIGEGIPIFEIRDAIGMSNMLVSNNQSGAALAKTLGRKPAALMRGHGVAVVGASLGEAVARTQYMTINAQLQSQAMAMGKPIQFLAPEEAAKAGATDIQRKNWEMWTALDDR